MDSSPSEALVVNKCLETRPPSTAESTVNGVGWVDCAAS